MDKNYFETLLDYLVLYNSEQCTGNSDMIKSFVDDARELAGYGELRIALENLLENMIDIDAQFTDEMIKITTKAFGQIISEYDKKLLDIVIQNKIND